MTHGLGELTAATVRVKSGRAGRCANTVPRP
jgi:hypothetical protein